MFKLRKLLKEGKSSFVYSKVEIQLTAIQYEGNSGEEPEGIKSSESKIHQTYADLLRQQGYVQRSQKTSFIAIRDGGRQKMRHEAGQLLCSRQIYIAPVEALHCLDA